MRSEATSAEPGSHSNETQHTLLPQTTDDLKKQFDHVCEKMKDALQSLAEINHQLLKTQIIHSIWHAGVKSNACYEIDSLVCLQEESYSPDEVLNFLVSRNLFGLSFLNIHCLTIFQTYIPSTHSIHKEILEYKQKLNQFFSNPMISTRKAFDEKPEVYSISSSIHKFPDITFHISHQNWKHISLNDFKKVLTALSNLISVDRYLFIDQVTKLSSTVSVGCTVLPIMASRILTLLEQKQVVETL